MKHKITFILLSLFLLNSTVGYSYQGEVFTLSSLTATEKNLQKLYGKQLLLQETELVFLLVRMNL